MPIRLANNASTTLPNAVAAADTSVTLSSGEGSQFPALASGDYFYATLVAPWGVTEVVKVTARSSDTLTIVRAQGGTSALTLDAGALFELRNNKENIEDLVSYTVAASTVGITVSDATVIDQPLNRTYKFLAAGWNGFINSVVTQTETGTCTVTVDINGTPLGGSANSASTSKQTQAHTTSNAVAEGDDISITVSSVSSASFLSVTIVGTIQST